MDFAKKLRTLRRKLIRFQGSPLVITAAVTLLCIFIALVISWVYPASRRDVLIPELSAGQLFSPSTYRTIAEAAGEPAEWYLYSIPEVKSSREGDLLSLHLQLAEKKGSRELQLWNLWYECSEDSEGVGFLRFSREQGSFSLRDLGFSFGDLFPCDAASYKNLANLPLQYLAEKRELGVQDYFRLRSVSKVALRNQSFSSWLSETVVQGVWVSLSGSCSLIDHSFTPTGNYLTLECTPMLAEEGGGKQLSYSGTREFLVLLEL